MVANLILTNRVGSIKKDFNTLWKYLNKAVELGSIAALNTMGNCYLNGINPNKEIDVEKAIKYYLDASEYGYVYSYNNLGKIYEKNNDFDKSFEYYKLSADLNAVPFNLVDAENVDNFYEVVPTGFQAAAVFYFDELKPFMTL